MDRLPRLAGGLFALVIALAACTQLAPSPHVPDVRIDAGDRTVGVGGTLTLSASVSGSPTGAVQWASDAPDVASVDALGSPVAVLGQTVGTATITATSIDDPSRSDSVEVHVVAPAGDGPLAPSAATVPLTPSASSTSFAVGYSGGHGESISVTATSSDARIAVTPTRFTLRSGAWTTVTVAAAASSSSYGATIRFASAGLDDAVVQVSYTAPSTAEGCFIEPGQPLAVQGLESARAAATSGASPYVPDQLLVTYAAAETEAAGARAERAAVQRLDLAVDVAQRAGAHLVRIGQGGLPDVMAVPGGDLDAAAARLSADPRVRLVTRNYYVERLQAAAVAPRSAAATDAGARDAAPGDGAYTAAAGAGAYAAQWHLYDFGLEIAWAAESGSGSGADVVVAVLDDGFNVTHHALAPKALPGRDVYCGDGDVRGVSLHGSHVAAIAVGGGSGGVVAGVARGGRARLLPVKVFPDDPEMPGTLEAVLRGLRFAAGLDGTASVRADVINMSIGFGSTLSPSAVAMLQETVDRVHTEGVVLVAAAGNSGTSGIVYPAKLERVLAVGSVDWEFTRSTFSSFGTELDLMAPGGTAPAGATSDRCRPSGAARASVASAGHTSDGAVACSSGTSMAAAFVSGTAALLIAADGSVRGRPDAVVARLLGGAMQPTSVYSRSHFGAGIVCPDVLLNPARRTACGEPLP